MPNLEEDWVSIKMPRSSDTKNMCKHPAADNRIVHKCTSHTEVNGAGRTLQSHYDALWVHYTHGVRTAHQNTG